MLLNDSNELILQKRFETKVESVTFCTWQHFQKNDQLLESGLIGSIVLKSAISQILQMIET